MIKAKSANLLISLFDKLEFYLLIIAGNDL